MASSEAGPSRPLIDPAVLAASSSAATIARLITHPLDTIRLRIQTHRGQKLPPLKELIPSPPSRLYAGLPVALTFSVPALSCYLTAYEAAKRIWAPILIDPANEAPTLAQQFPAYMLSGLTAEVISGWIWTPMEVAKSRLQKGNDGTSAYRLLRKVWQDEGPRGVWRGYTVSIAVFGPYTAIYWPVYEEMKAAFVPGYDPRRGTLKPTAADSDVNVTSRFAGCAAVACSISATLTHPIAVVQSMVQTSGGKVPGGGQAAGEVKEATKRASGQQGHVRSIVRAMWKAGGWRAFTRGASARILYMVPSNITSMVLYEQIKHYLIRR